MPPHRGLLDTSVFIARESGRPADLTRVPDSLAVSVVTLAELRAGVLAASTTEARARRLAMFERAREIHVVAIDEAAGLVWAQLRAGLAERGARANVNDLWIAATAVAHRLAVVTQDEDFDVLAEVVEFEVVRI